MYPMRLSLRYRLLLPLALLLVGDAAVTAWAATSAADAADRRLAGQLWGIARTLTEPRSNFPLTERVLEQMKGFSGAEFLYVHPNRPPATTLRAPNTPPPADVPLATPAAEGEDHALGPPVRVDGTEYLCL